MTRPLGAPGPVVPGLLSGRIVLILDKSAVRTVESAPPPMDSIALPLVAAVVSLGLLVLSLYWRKRHRLLADTPTSKTQGVFIGLVELKGTAECAAPLTSYLAQAPCVHYRWEVAERWSRTVTETVTHNGKTTTRTRRESGWKTVTEGGETTDFYLRDDTGHVLVRPADAKLEPATLFAETVSRGDALYYAKGPDGAVAHSDGVRRFTETGLPLHAPLFVVGRARERDDVVAPEIAADKDAELFLISARTEEKVVRGYGLASWVAWFFGLLVALGAALPFADSVNRELPVGPLLVAAAIFGALWLLGWLWMAYNSLVALRERVRQAWSLIDVQLKRRHDLIPGLVATLTALRDHEASLQTALAALRAQATATPPGVAGPDHHGLARELRVVAERYPELKSAPEFRRLADDLVATEQRLALTRSYYNDIATHFATRLEIVPDRWVAALARMQPAPLLGAADFERAAVTVDFARSS